MDTPKLGVISLRNALQSGGVTVEFRKKDNTIRIMYCTTNLEQVPPEHHPKTKEQEEDTSASELFKVYEFNNGWRSFNFDQVIKWNKI